MIKTYIEFMTMGVMFAETSVREVSTRVPPFDIPDSCYAYRFFEQSRGETSMDGERVQVAGERRNVSPLHFILAEVWSRTTIASLVADGRGDLKILLENMLTNNWNQVVKCRTGTWLPFGKEDMLVDRHGVFMWGWTVQ